MQNSAAADEPAGLVWRKSSATSGANCVEAAFVGEIVLVRDSKDRTRKIGLSRDADGISWTDELVAQDGRLTDLPVQHGLVEDELGAWHVWRRACRRALSSSS